MKIIKSIAAILAIILIISCGKTKVINHSSQSIDSVSVYLDDKYDKIPKNKIIYDTVWGNTPDSLKPKFDLNFCNENFNFPYYFPATEQLTGKAQQTITVIENENLELILRTFHKMTYDKSGRIIYYSITGPSTLYRCSYLYDDNNRIVQISEGSKKIKISYKDIDNIETLTEINLTGEITKLIKFQYTYKPNDK